MAHDLSGFIKGKLNAFHDAVFGSAPINVIKDIPQAQMTPRVQAAAAQTQPLIQQAQQAQGQANPFNVAYRTVTPFAPYTDMMSDAMKVNLTPQPQIDSMQKMQRDKSNYFIQLARQAADANQRASYIRAAQAVSQNDPSVVQAARRSAAVTPLQAVGASAAAGIGLAPLVGPALGLAGVVPAAAPIVNAGIAAPLISKFGSNYAYGAAFGTANELAQGQPILPSLEAGLTKYGPTAGVLGTVASLPGVLRNAHTSQQILDAAEQAGIDLPEGITQKEALTNLGYAGTKIPGGEAARQTLDHSRGYQAAYAEQNGTPAQETGGYNLSVPLEQKGSVETIPLKQIKIDPSFIESPSGSPDSPPILHRLPDGSYEVFDGMHRLAAEAQAGNAEIQAIIVDPQSPTTIGEALGHTPAAPPQPELNPQAGFMRLDNTPDETAPTNGALSGVGREPNTPSVDNSVPGVPAGEKPRGFLETVQNSPTTSDQVQGAVSDLPQGYTPITNDATFQAAADRIKQGKYTAYDFVLNKGPLTADKVATAQLLANQFADEGDVNRAREVINAITAQGTTGGQGIQAFSVWDKLSPANLLKLANNAAKNAGEQLPEEFQNSVIVRANDIQAMPEGAARIQATQGLLKDIAEALPPTKGEIFRAFRYNNMLSSPVTLGRISYGGLFNTVVTRPASLAAEATTQSVHSMFDSDFEKTVSYSDIPAWYKNVYTGLPKAWQNGVDGFNTGNIDKAFQEGNPAASTIQTLRQENVPSGLTVFGRLHTALYKFVGSLVGGAEQARLMENGVDEATATEQATRLADQLTLRGQLGDVADKTKAVQAIDSLGRIVQRGQDLPGIGPAINWAAPFMRVSTNFAKNAVEYSALSLPDAAYNFATGAEGGDTQFAHAALGSLLTGVGLKYALDGNVTLAAPTDVKQSELFYASGRKPYSFKVGNTWVPLQYLGPLSLAFILPAAYRDATNAGNAPKPLTSKMLVGLGDTLKAIVAETPLPSITGMFQFLSGDSSINASTLLADLSSQVIPYSAGTRWLAGIVDPIYRQASTVTERIKSGQPFLSKDLPAYVTPQGTPESRNITNSVLPYALGVENKSYEPAYQSRENTLESNAIIKQANDTADKGTKPNMGSGGQVAPGIYQLPDGTYSYQTTDENGQSVYKQAKSVQQAQAGIDKNNFATSDTDAAYTNGVLYQRADDGTVTSTKLNLDKIAAMPTDTLYNKALQQTQVFAVANKIADSQLSATDKLQAYQSLGISGEDADYYNTAKQNTEAKTAYVEDLMSNAGGDIMASLSPLRREVNGAAILTDAVITELHTRGRLTTGQAKALRALKYNADTGKVTSMGGSGRKPSSAILRAFKAPARLSPIKPVKMVSTRLPKQPKLRALKPPKTKVRLVRQPKFGSPKKARFASYRVSQHRV